MRSIVKQHNGDVKTEASKKQIPLDDDLVAELLAWRKEAPYAGDSDYAFASLKMKPYWMSKIMQLYIKLVAAHLGIPLKGWHTPRHGYTTLLRQNGNNPKVVQDLRRHAWYGLTMNVYGSAVLDEKREAHSGVMRLIATRTQTRTGPADGRMASA
jgi:integrase